MNTTIITGIYSSSNYIYSFARNEIIKVKRDDGWSCDSTAWIDQEGYYVFGPADNNGVEAKYLGVDL